MGAIERGSLTMKTWTVVATFMAVCSALASADVPDSAFTAESAFAQLIKLEGTWTGESVTVPVGSSKEEATPTESSVTFETIANNTSVIATFLDGSPMEMVSVYHMDGPETLIHTHYCAAGNQPSMKFTATGEPGVIKFEFTHGTNMDVNKDGHAHDGFIRIVDQDTIETTSNQWRDGKTAAVRYATLKRQPDAGTGD